MPVSHSQTLTTGFGLTGDQASDIRKCSVLPSLKSGVREYVRYTENRIYVTGNCARREHC